MGEHDVGVPARQQVLDGEHAGMARDDEHVEVWPQTPRLLRHRHAVRLRHAHVRDQQIDRLVGQALQRF